MEWSVVFVGSLAGAAARRAKLAAAGIEAVSPDANGRMLDPHFSGPAFAFFEVRVPRPDEARARAVLSEPDPVLGDERASD